MLLERESMPRSRKVLSEKYHALCTAIRRRNKAKVEALLLDNAPLNTSYPAHRRDQYNSPLHWAVAHFHDKEFIAMLIDRGGRTDFKNGCNQTPFHIAIALNREDIIQLFLDKQGYIIEDLCTLILEATAKKNEKLIRYLVEFGIKEKRYANVINSVDEAVKYGYMDILHYLLNYCKTYKQNNHYVRSDTVMENGSRAMEVSDLLLEHGFTIFSREDEENFLTTYAAVQNKSLNIVKNALDLSVAGLNIYNKDTGRTFLHVACINKDAEMMKLLIEHKADLNLRVLITPKNSDYPTGHPPDSLFYGLTSLYIGVHTSSVEVVKLLILNGADLIDDTQRYPLLLSAIHHSLPEIGTMLVNHGADVNVIDTWLRTPLHYCISNRFRELGMRDRCYFRYRFRDIEAKAEFVELLLKKGANPNNSRFVPSPLQLAVSESYLEVIEVLFKYGADINFVNTEGNTALHLAITESDSATLDLVLKHNPDLNIRNRRGMLPLHIAAIVGKPGMLEVLIKYNVDVDSVNEAGNTALHILCYMCKYPKHFNSIMMLLKLNANVNARNNEGCTPLHMMLLRKSMPNPKVCVGIITALLKHKAHVNCVENLGVTPLTLACMNSHFDIIKVLLNYGANINSTTRDGRTSLHWAVLQDNADVFEFLLNQGADVTILCKKQRSAFSYIFSRMRGVDLFVHLVGYDNSVASNAHFNMYRAARNHIIKLRCAKFTNSRGRNLRLNNATKEVNKIAYYLANQYEYEDVMSTSQITAQCKKEIQALKFYGLIDLGAFLHNDVRSIAVIARNKPLTHLIQSDEFDSKFPQYASMVKRRFAEAMKVKKMLDFSERLFLSSFFRGMPLLCVDHIFDYLDLKDLKTFVRAMK